MIARFPTPWTSWRLLLRTALLLLIAAAIFLMPWARQETVESLHPVGLDDSVVTTRSAHELIGLQLLDDMLYGLLAIAGGLLVLMLALRAWKGTTRPILLAEIGFAGMLCAGFPDPAKGGFFSSLKSATPAAGFYCAFCAIIAWQLLNLWDVFQGPYEERDVWNPDRVVTTVIAAAFAAYGMGGVIYTYVQFS